jgi:hypothetical protein
MPCCSRCIHWSSIWKLTGVFASVPSEKVPVLTSSIHGCVSSLAVRLKGQPGARGGPPSASSFSAPHGLPTVRTCSGRGGTADIFSRKASVASMVACGMPSAEAAHAATAATGRR